jgi:hypothetical protein
MQTFIDVYDLSKRLHGKKVCVDDVISTYSKKPESHKSSWTFLVINQLRHAGIDAKLLEKGQDVNEFDAWLVLLPMDYKGTFNMFSGASDENAHRINRLAIFNGDIFCLNERMPDYGTVLLSRMNSCEDFWKSLNPSQFSDICSNVPTVRVVLRSEVFAMGDSHTVSVYVPGSNINRNDGKTLYGAIKDGDLSKFIYDGVYPKNVITYFGNIDVRHHLLRESNPQDSAVKLCNKYMESLVKLMDSYELETVSPVCLLPIENEDRRIPKTGWYKGTPFFGSREERSNVMRLFNDELMEHSSRLGFAPITWPDFWYTIDPEEYSSKFMEKPGSVHLSRSSYQYNFENDEKNKFQNPNRSVALF